MELIQVLLLIFMLSPAAMSQPAPSIPTNTVPNSIPTNTSSVCFRSLVDPSLQQACDEDLYSKVGVTIEDYTQKFAQRFSVCIGDPKQERDAAFGFGGNMSFLS
eukprot:c8847_g1_i1 orf=3-311(-)